RRPPVRSKPVRCAAPIASPNITACCVSRRNSARRRRIAVAPNSRRNFTFMRWLNIFLLLILLGLQYRLWVGAGSWADVAALDRNIEQQQEKNERRMARNQLLEGEVISLKSGLDAIEERARNDLGMIKRDEPFYLVVDPE